MEIDSQLFRPHPNLDDAINDAICRSEIDGGVQLDSLPYGTVLKVQTSYHTYRIENRGGGEVMISGHPEFCPEPVLANFHGCTWGTPMIRRRYIGRGLRMEINYPELGTVLTSRVHEIEEVAA